MYDLMTYQKKSVASIWSAFEQGARAPLLVLPTGGGKTVVFTYIAKRIAEKGYRVGLIAHRKELINQISTALKNWECAHGIITPDAKITNHPVQVAMVQTLASRIKIDRAGRYKFDFLIIDECHHATRDSTWGSVLLHSPDAKILGVSATPCRLDGKGLGVQSKGFFDNMIIGPTMSELIDLGQLVKPVIYAPTTQIDLSEVKKVRGDYAMGALVVAVDRAKITGDAVENYRKYCNNRSAIAFTITTCHAGHVADQFTSSGYQAAVLTGKTPDKERARMIRDLGNGSLHVLASCNVVSEGTDIPTVFSALLLRPTQSYALNMQQIGRALRSSPGKTECIILDHADNVRRHGMPTDDVDWSLDGLDAKKHKTSKAATKVCRCGVILRISTSQCDRCGRVFEKGGVARTNFISVRDGELSELSPDEVMAKKAARTSEFRNAKTKYDLVKLGRQRNYKYPEAWADKILEERRAYQAHRIGTTA